MRRVVSTGATGGIGSALCKALLDRGDQPVALSRDPGGANASLPDGARAFAWRDTTAEPAPAEALSGADAVVNLLGETIAQRWTTDAKQKIRDSRVKSTQMLVAALRELPPSERPKILISQSASGYYGDGGEQELTEQAAPGRDFLAGVVVDWEQAALPAAEFMRVSMTRTGVVLSRSAGALAKMMPFFKAGIGGPVAGGEQYVPWIHSGDVVRALLFCLDHETISGPVNLTAPHPAKNKDFSRALGKALHRPAVLPVPGLALKAMYGEMSEIVLSGQRALPDRLTAQGFVFDHPEINEALADTLDSD